jgi:hypothetical protein
MMKKTPLKLVVHREVVRVLAQLDLARVIGANPDARLMDTESRANTCAMDTEGPNHTCIQAA